METRLFTLWLVSALCSAEVGAAEHEIRQKDMKFSQTKLTVKVGDAVSFKNDDSVFHNIFSLSEEKTFDLGAIGKGQARKVTFDKAGVVEIECALHPAMQLRVEVKK